MNILKIPQREAFLLDANVILYAIERSSNQCERLMERCARREVSGILSTHILAEVMHRLMVAEAKDAGWLTGSNPARQLASQPNRIKTLNRYEETVRDLLTVGLVLESPIREDFITAMELQRRFGLMTNDALLLALGTRLRITSIASADQIFKEIPGFLYYAPDDLE